MPPRHGKTELLLAFIVWALHRDPSLNICYVTYSAEQAIAKSHRALSIADATGLELERRTGSQWATPQNEFVLWTGVGGPLAGKGFDIIIIDDPVKNRAEAESPTYRAGAWDFYQSDLITRLEPGGNFICVQTRWHEDDLAGRLTHDDEDEDFEALDCINVPAIANEGVEGEEKALWPERWGLAALKKRHRRVGDYAWASLYQGQPRPRGTTVFGEPSFYTALPTTFRAAQGLDLGYTEKKTADYSVCGTLLREDRNGEAHYFVRRVIRKQLRAPEFKDVLRLERARFPHTRCRIYASGTERGTTDFMQAAEKEGGRVTRPGVTLEVLVPEGDKFTRALPFAEAWNAGRVHLPDPSLLASNPAEYGWLNDFLTEMRSFTGTGKDANDDQVDALVAAFDVLNQEVAGFSRKRAEEGNRRRL